MGQDPFWISRKVPGVIHAMVFLPHRMLNRKPSASKLHGPNAQIIQVALLFLLVGGWSMVSNDWISAAGVKGFATFAFLILMALLFYSLGRAYGTGERALMYVYVVPSLFFLTATFLFFATTAGVERLGELLVGGDLLSAIGPSIFLGLLALIVFSFAFFQLGTGRFHPAEVLMILFFLGWTAFILFLPTPVLSLRSVNSALSLLLLTVLLAIAYFRKETWLMGYALFFTALFIGLKFLD